MAESFLLPTTEVIKIGQEIARARHIALIAHKKPDGDALGSLLALGLALRNLGKHVDLITRGPIPTNLKFLRGHEDILFDFPALDYDLYITLDCGDAPITGFANDYPQLFSEFNLVNIDHHPSNKGFGKLNIVIPQACSTSAIVYRLLKSWNIGFNIDIATALLTGLYTDTGSFMHANTSATSYRIAGELLSRGANHRLIINSIFKNTPLSTLRLWGRVLDHLKQTSKGITVAVVTQQDFLETGAKEDELSGVVDFVNSVPNSLFSILLTEQKEHFIKGSMRTLRDDVNLSRIAESFGGGGHTKAAGFTIPGHLEQEVRWKIVNEQQEILVEAIG